MGVTEALERPKEFLNVKHLKQKSKPKMLPAYANAKGGSIQNPCPDLEGKDLCKCEKKAYKGGVVY